MFKWLKPRPTRLFYVLLQNGASHEIYSDKQKVNINDRTVIFYHKGQIMAVFLNFSFFYETEEAPVVTRR